MSGLRKPLLTAAVIRGLDKLLPSLPPEGDSDRDAAIRYLHALVRYSQSEGYQRKRDAKNQSVRDAKAKRKAKLP